jgi:hypothetical protein
MFITLLVVGCLGAVAGQGDAFEPYLREHKAFGKAVAAMICLYGEFSSILPVIPLHYNISSLTPQCSHSIWHGGLSHGLCTSFQSFPSSDINRSVLLRCQLVEIVRNTFRSVPPCSGSQHGPLHSPCHTCSNLPMQV